MAGDMRDGDAHLREHDARARYCEEDDSETSSSFMTYDLQMMQGGANDGLGGFLAGIVHNSAHRLHHVAVSPLGPPLLRCDKPNSVLENQPLTPRSLAPATCSMEIPANEIERPASLSTQHLQLSRGSNSSTAAAAMAIAAAASAKGDHSWQTPPLTLHCPACAPNAPGRGAVATGLPTAQAEWDSMSPVAARNNAAHWQQLLLWLDNSSDGAVPRAATAAAPAAHM